jgi:hypothetical protein
MEKSDPGKTSRLRNTAGTYSVDFVGVTFYIIEHIGTVHTLGAMQVPYLIEPQYLAVVQSQFRQLLLFFR